MVWKLSLQGLHIELFKSMGLAVDGSVFQLKLIDLSGKIKTFKTDSGFVCGICIKKVLLGENQ